MEQIVTTVENTEPKLTAWQRLETIVKMSGVSVNAFARSIGLARGENLYQIKKGNNGISRDLAKRIVDYYPQISFSWLMTGEGAMTIDGKNQTGIPFYNCSCPEDLQRLENDVEDGCVAMPGFEDCCAVVAHNWRSKDGVPEGAYVFLTRIERRKRYIALGQYFVVSEGYAGFCSVRTLRKVNKLKLMGGKVPVDARYLGRDDVQTLYMVRGVLTITSAAIDLTGK